MFGGVTLRQFAPPSSLTCMSPSSLPTQIHPRATEGLSEAYKTDTNEDVRKNSAVALARFGDPIGRATLEEMRSSDNATHRVEARKALRLLDKAAATAP